MQPEHVLCPILVGREDEMTTLRAALDRAAQGGVRGVFIGGEAGLGKSRLCRVLIQDARLRGLTPLIGLCSPQDTALPYGPLVDALRRTFTRLPPDRLALPPELALLLPELGTSLPRDLPDAPVLLRQRLCTALAQALRAIAAYRVSAGSIADRSIGAPIVLILEDLHWADESTLEFLTFLMRSTWGVEEELPAQQPGLLIVGTFRSEHLPSAPALARTLSTAVTARLALQLELHALTEQQLTRMLEATLGYTIPPATAGALFERSEGNPFVTEELLGAMAAAGRLDHGLNESLVLSEVDIPLSLRSAVLERIESLPAPARTLLSAAAAAGRVFDIDLLARVTDLDRATLLDALRLSVRRGLIEENPARGGSAMGTTGDSYRFRHSLTRDVIYTELLAPERRALHTALAAVLQERVAAGDADATAIEALAYHYRLAGDHVKAAEFAIRAAERARSLLAFAEARRHYDDALSYLAPHDPARLPLLEQLGLLSLALLDLRGAISHLDDAIALLRSLGLHRKAAVVLGELHHLIWYVDLARYRRMVEAIDAAAEAARSGADGAGPEDADALALYAAAAFVHASYYNHDRAYLWARRTLDLANTLEQAGTPASTLPATYKALIARGGARLHGHGDKDVGDEAMAEAGLRDFYDALELGLRYALPEVVQLAYNVLPRGLLEVGRDAEAAAMIDQAEDYARRSGVVITADTRGYSLLFSGHWQEGIEAMRAAIDVSRSIGSPGKMALELTALGHLLTAQGDAAGARAALEEALSILEPGGQFFTLGPCLIGLAHAHTMQGHTTDAAAVLTRAYDLWKTTQDRTTVAPLLLVGCLIFAATGESVQAGAWADELDRVVAANPMPASAAAAAHARGGAAAANGRYADACALLHEAVEHWDSLSRPYIAAQARVSLGMAILAGAPQDRRHRAEADTILVAATETFARLGARYDEERVEDFRRRSGLLAQARRRQSLAAVRAPFSDLTPRERDVLILLAEGRTNREIARTLFIAEGTAELHVSHILGKLGCTSRAQAAAYAVAQGLVAPR